MTDTAPCTHHWICELPNMGFVKSTCKLCGAARTFDHAQAYSNAVSNAKTKAKAAIRDSQAAREAALADIPPIPDEEPEPELPDTPPAAPAPSHRRYNNEHRLDNSRGVVYNTPRSTPLAGNHYQPKPCIYCKLLFTPTGGRTRACDPCKAQMKLQYGATRNW